MPNVITAREGTIMVTMAVKVMHVNELTEIEGMEMKKCIREEEDMIQDHHIVGKKSVCQVMMTIIGMSLRDRARCFTRPMLVSP